MAEIKQQSITELQAKLDQVYAAKDYAAMQSIASAIRKLQQAKFQANLVANQAKIEALIESIKHSKELGKLVSVWLKEARTLVGVVACIGFEVDPNQGNLINAWVQSRKQKARSGNSRSDTKGEPNTSELLELYGSAKAAVRWDKAPHEGTFNELYAAAKSAIDKSNATYNVRQALVKFHKGQSKS